MDGILSVWVITWRIVWPAMLLALLLPVVIATFARRTAFAPGWAYWGSLAAPVVVVLWSGMNWAIERGIRAGMSRWASWVLLGLTLAGIAGLVFTLSRTRRHPRY